LLLTVLSGVFGRLSVRVRPLALDRDTEPEGDGSAEEGHTIKNRSLELPKRSTSCVAPPMATLCGSGSIATSVTTRTGTKINTNTTVSPRARPHSLKVSFVDAAAGVQASTNRIVRFAEES
jgi:hypothetical protein